MIRPQITPVTIPSGNDKKRKAAAIIRDLKLVQRSSAFVFRGVSKESFDLIPSVSRSRANGKDFDEKDEKILLKLVKTEGFTFRDWSNLSDLDLLSLAQHFGAPTRLMDWTTNPLAAVYFSIFLGENISEDEDGVIYIYKTEKSEIIQEKYDLNLVDNDLPMFPSKIFAKNIRFIIPKFVDARIRNQSGLFSVHSDPKKRFEEICEPGRLTYMKIPKDIKVTMARYIYGLGITHDFIRPDFSGFCNNLKYRYHSNIGLMSHVLESEI